MRSPARTRSRAPSGIASRVGDVDSFKLRLQSIHSLPGSHSPYLCVGLGRYREVDYKFTKLTFTRRRHSRLKVHGYAGQGHGQMAEMEVPRGPIDNRSKIFLKSPCTSVSASSAGLAVQGLLRQILHTHLPLQFVS